MYYINQSSQHWEAGTIIISILQMRRLRHRVEKPSNLYKATQQVMEPDLNLGHVTLEPVLWPHPAYRDSG